MRTIIIIVLCLGLLSTVSLSQEDGACIPTEDAAQQVLALFGSYVSGARVHDPSQYTTAYLMLENATPSDSLLSADSIAKFSDNIEIKTSWDEFIAFNQETPVDVLFIHESIAESVDREWLQSAYSSGLPIVTLNMSFGERAELIGDRCVFAEHPADGPLNGNPAKITSGDFYIFSYWLLKGGDTASAIDSALKNCDEDSNGNYETRSGAGFGVVSIAEDLNKLFNLALLANDIEIRMVLDNVQNQADAIMAASCRPPLNTQT